MCLANVSIVWTWSLLDCSVGFLQNSSLHLNGLSSEFNANENCFRSSMIKFQLPFLFLGISKPQKRRKLINLPYQVGSQSASSVGVSHWARGVLPIVTKSVMGCHGSYLRTNWIETEISWYQWYLIRHFFIAMEEPWHWSTEPENVLFTAALLKRRWMKGWVQRQGDAAQGTCTPRNLGQTGNVYVYKNNQKYVYVCINAYIALKDTHAINAFIHWMVNNICVFSLGHHIDSHCGFDASHFVAIPCMSLWQFTATKPYQICQIIRSNIKELKQPPTAWFTICSWPMHLQPSSNFCMFYV